MFVRPTVLTIVAPVISAIFFRSYLMPISSATSDIFRAITIGFSSSNNCAAKYKLRSKLDASRTLTITSGLSFTMTLRATNSSKERAVKLYVPGKSINNNSWPSKFVWPSFFSTVTPA